MSTATYVDKDGKTTGQVDLPGDIFDIEPNVPVMHAAVKAHLAAIRAGTHSTKTRAEVRGGGKKPWRQKGTGRARHGSTREPQWVGGGVAHGPKPRDYSFSLTKKTRALALRCALSDRAREGSIIVVDLPVFDAPTTKRAKGLLASWGATGKVLLITGSPPPDSGDTHLDTWKSFRNLANVLMVQAPTTYRVLAADVVVLTREALAQITKTEALPEPHPADRVPDLEPASPAAVAAVVHAAIDAVVEAELQDQVVAALLPEVEAQAEALTGEEEGGQ